MKKGRAVPLMLLGLVAFGAVAATGYVLREDPQIDAYREFGRRINGLDQSGFDGFWACALPGTSLSNLREASALIEELHGRGAAGRAAYAAQVRDQCLPRLAQLEVGLESPKTPEALTGEVRTLHDAAVSLRGGWSDYLGLLEGIPSGDAYDRETANTAVTTIARGWYDYKRAFGTLNDHLRTRLQP